MVNIIYFIKFTFYLIYIHFGSLKKKKGDQFYKYFVVIN
jgi:hypothetical protein